MRHFVKSGGILLCDNLPSESCGLLNWERDAGIVRSYLQDAAPILVENRREALINALRQRLHPDVLLSRPETVGYVHRAEGNTHLYFLSNLSDESCVVTARFQGRWESARAWSVNDGSPMALSGTGEICTFHMEAHGTVVVVFDPELADAPRYQAAPEPTHEQVLTGWCLTVNDCEMEMEEPISWEKLPGQAHFSGEGTYECEFDAPNPDADLCLNGLSAAARVWLNGQLVRDVWTHLIC